MTASNNNARTAREIISFFFIFLFPIFEAGCYALLYSKRQNLSIQKRLASIQVAALAAWIAYFNLLISVFGGVPCVGFYVASLVVAPISVGPQLIRALNLRGSLEYSRLIVEDELSNREDRKKGESSSNNVSNPNNRRAESVIKNTRELVKKANLALLVVPSVLIIVALALSSDSNQLIETEFALCHPEPASLQFASAAFFLMSATLALAASSLIKHLDDELGLQNEICRNVSFLGVAFILTMGIKLAGHSDLQPLLQTVQQMILSFSMIIIPCFPDVNFGVNSFGGTQKKRIIPATKSAVPGYGRPLPKGRRKTRSSLTGGRRGSSSVPNAGSGDRSRETLMSWDAGLCILLSTEEGIKTFSQHCAREFSSENVRFWCAINEYRAKFDEEKGIQSSECDTEETTVQACDKNEIKEKAKEIYQLFIAPSASSLVNLSSKQKNDLKAVIDSGNLVKESFDGAQREIFSLMSRDSYPRFLASKTQKLSLTK